MLQKKILLIILTFFYLSNCFANEVFLSLKKSKVNVRYGPSLESPIKYVYKKINLPIKQIDKNENFRRIIDVKNNTITYFNIFLFIRLFCKSRFSIFEKRQG